MQVTKFGHCCLLIEINGVRILTDPGSFTVDTHVVSDIDIVLITHEHADHLHTESLKEILAKSPKATVFSNHSVGALLTAAEVPYTELEGTARTECCGVTLAACDAPHAEIFETVGLVQNTGYHIGGRLFYPGDSYAEPRVPVEVLALPVGGPWCRMTDALHYALRVAPKAVFPVHDGIEREDRVTIHYGLATRILGEEGIMFTPLRAGEKASF